MKTFILPGFSLHNKDWAEKTQQDLINDLKIEIIYWLHWDGGPASNTWSHDQLSLIPTTEPINIIAKSLGTHVCMLYLKEHLHLINKLILCGIPLTDISASEREDYRILANFPTNKLLCIQNSNDTHGNYEEAKAFIANIKSDITIISKPRDDHEYPFQEDFKKFLQ